MATNYTTRSTGTPLPEKDRRAIAVSKKVQIGGKGGTIVSDDKVVTKEVVTKDLFIDYDGKSTNVSQILKNIKPASSGITVIGSNNEYAGATKIQFQGDNIYISRLDDGTILITIGKITIPTLSMVTESTTTQFEAKHVFSSSTGAWNLPTSVEQGQLYDQCYQKELLGDITLTLNGESGDFGFENLTTTLSIDLHHDGTITNISSVLLDGNQTDGNGWDFETATKIGNGIKFDSIKYTISADSLKDIVADSNLWKIVCTADSKTVETSEKFTYNSFAPIPEDGAEITVEDTYVVSLADDQVETDQTPYVSGIAYDVSKQPTGFIVNTVPCTNVVNRVGNDATIRGKVTISDADGLIGTTDYRDIVGATTDTEATKIESAALQFNLLEGISNYKIEQEMYSVGEDNIVITKNHTSTWSEGSGYELTPDTFNTINLYTEDISGEYNRILGHIVDESGDAYLTASTENYDSRQTVVDNSVDAEYNKQAVIQNGKLIHPSKVDTTIGTLPTNSDGETIVYATDTITPRYYVRKITRSTESTDQNPRCRLNIKLDLSSDNVDLWLVQGAQNPDDMYGISIRDYALEASVSGQYIDFQVSDFDSGFKYENSMYYLVIALNDVDAYIQGPISLESRQ